MISSENSQVQHRRHAVGLEGAEALALDLLDRMGQLGHADGHRQAAVLEQRHAVVDQRRHRIAHRLRHQHVAHRADVAVAQRARRLGLPGRDRTQAGAHVLAEVGGLAQAQRDDREHRLGVVLGQPALQRVGQQAEDAEVPEHQLHQRRHVAVVGDVGRDRALGDAAGRQAHHQQHDGQASSPAARSRPRSSASSRTPCSSIAPNSGLQQDRQQVEVLHAVLSCGCGAQACAAPAAWWTGRRAPAASA